MITSMIQLVQLYLFCLLIQYCVSSPTNSGAGNTDDDTIIDCTLPPAAQTSFDGLTTGLRVLQKYSMYCLNGADPNVLLPALHPTSGCSMPVEYKHCITTGITPTTNNTANWYTVYLGLVQYLEALQIDDTANSELDTLVAVFNAVNEEFFQVLQDLHCNCSTNCTVKLPHYKAMSASCPSQIMFLKYYLSSIMIPHTINTVNQYNQVCEVCTTGIPSDVEPMSAWVKMHFPKDYPILHEMLKN